MRNRSAGGPPASARILECGDLSPLLRRRLVAVGVLSASALARVPALARATGAPLHNNACRTSTATSRLAKAVTSHRTPKPARAAVRNLDCGDSSPLLRRRLVAVGVLSASALARVPALARAAGTPLHNNACRSSTATSRLAKAVTSHRTPKPARAAVRNLDCGDLSPLLRRRLVAVGVPSASARARVPALARATGAPLHNNACRSSTATSRLEKAVTSHRTPKPARAR